MVAPQRHRIILHFSCKLFSKDTVLALMIETDKHKRKKCSLERSSRDVSLCKHESCFERAESINLGHFVSTEYARHPRLTQQRIVR